MLKLTLDPVYWEVTNSIVNRNYAGAVKAVAKSIDPNSEELTTRQVRTIEPILRFVLRNQLSSEMIVLGKKFTLIFTLDKSYHFV